MARQPIQIVDEKDSPLRAGSRNEAWKDGLWHRIVYVMVESPEGKILLQKRSAKMDTYANCWDTSASGHVDAGESYGAAAKRELAEEIGIKDAKLTLVGTYQSRDTFGWRQMNRFNKVYKLVLPEDTPFRLQRSELDSVRWFSHKELKDLVTKHPEQIANGLRRVFRLFYI